ncbi:MAG TPA: hypothetical protein PLB81_01845 [Deltaproteobacteria bacterium]|nr:hypothetical protein [Deltaproteobacteria bacterium]
MEFYIALCAHFHQPHFQAEETLHAVFKNSYDPWLGFLERVRRAHPGFTMNIHFSGPLLQYTLRSKPGYIQALRRLVEQGAVRIVGGLGDESFTQLSSRPDDTYYQVGLYQDLAREAFGLEPKDWDAFHIPERECGENLIVQLTRALARFDAQPLFYLDVETFFRTDAPETAMLNDPTHRYFGVSDPAQKTTVSSFAESGLHGIYRDEILGREFFVAPIHAQLRYFFLKKKSLFGTDPPCTPAQYLDIIRERAMEAGALIRKKSGRDIPPLLLIYADAETLGQSSLDPEGDGAWLAEFVDLANHHSQERFTSLRGYFETFGYVDTYPIKTSASSPEFENWAMKRGIRGVSYVDPQLRRVISVLRQLEETQERIDRVVLEKASKGLRKRQADHLLLEWINDKFMASQRRSDFVRRFLKQYWGGDEAKGYDIINRIRNLVYQEDPRWASRHPSFGSCASFDLTGLGYCAIAQKLGDALMERLTGRESDKKKTYAVLKDWDKDGSDEAVITNYHQNLIISRKGGTIVHHQVHSPYLMSGKYEDLLAFGADILANLPVFPAVGFYSQCLLHTDADSDLCIQLDGRQSRLERCRDSLRVNVLTIDGADRVKIGDLDTAMFDITAVRRKGRKVEVELATVQKLAMRSETMEFKVVKVFLVDGDSFAWKIQIEKLTNPGSPRWGRLMIAPEIVNSITPGGGGDKNVESVLCLHEGEQKGSLRADIQQTVFTDKGFDQRSQTLNVPLFEALSYAVFIKTERYGSLVEEYVYRLKKKTASYLKGLVVTPAVRRFHQGPVFDKKSRLGFHQSGVKIQPVFALSSGVKTTYEVGTERRLHAFEAFKPTGKQIPLIKS